MVRSRVSSHTHDGRAVGRVPSDTDPGGDVLLVRVVLRRNDDGGGGKLLGGGRRGLVVVEAERGHELDEGRQGGHWWLGEEVGQVPWATLEMRG